MSQKLIDRLREAIQEVLQEHEGESDRQLADVLQKRLNEVLKETKVASLRHVCERLGLVLFEDRQIGVKVTPRRKGEVVVDLTVGGNS